MATERTPNKEVSSTLRGTLSELTSSSGEPYFGIPVPESAINPYLELLRSRVGEMRYRELVETKAKRDGKNAYHLTVFKTPEINDERLRLGRSLIGVTCTLRLHGIGSVRQEKEGEVFEAYYVVVDSPEVNALRARAGLPPHTLHITLGFHPWDIYDLPKGKDTEIARL